MALDTRGLLTTCALLEEKVAELYHIFADLFAGVPELSKLWRKTALEEENHMQQFQLAARLEGSTAPTIQVDPAAVRSAVDAVTKLIEKSRQNPPGWEGALRFAIDLEERLAQFHMETAVSYVDDTFNGLFRAMMANDKQHVESLRDYLERPDGPAV